MEIIFEFILDLMVEAGIEASANKKVSKFIRYPLIAIIVLLFLIIIFGLLYFGIITLKENVPIGLIFIILSLVFSIFSVKKIRELYIEKKDTKKDI